MYQCIYSIFRIGVQLLNTVSDQTKHSFITRNCNNKLCKTKYVTTSVYVIKRVRVLTFTTFTGQSIDHNGVVVKLNKTHIDNVNHRFKKRTNSKLALFKKMQNCVETTSFVFKNVTLFVSYPKILPWKTRLGYVNRF